jgi:hypothetical protein
MKRSIHASTYEWCGLAFLSVAIICLVGLIASRLAASPILELAFGSDERTFVIVADGNLTLCDVNQDVIDLFNRSVPLNPAPTSAYSWGWWGFQLDYLGFERQQPIWAIRTSLLIPFIVFLVAGCLSLHRYRVVARQPSMPAPMPT